MDKRPPPYFPQTSLSPTDNNRYKKFKLVIGAAIVGLIALLIGLGYGVYQLVKWAAT